MSRRPWRKGVDSCSLLPSAPALPNSPPRDRQRLRPGGPLRRRAKEAMATPDPRNPKTGQPSPEWPAFRPQSQMPPWAPRPGLFPWQQDKPCLGGPGDAPCGPRCPSSRPRGLLARSASVPRSSGCRKAPHVHRLSSRTQHSPPAQPAAAAIPRGSPHPPLPRAPAVTRDAPPAGSSTDGRGGASKRWALRRASLGRGLKGRGRRGEGQGRVRALAVGHPIDKAEPPRGRASRERVELVRG